ncbi:SpoIIE family protein phosphatase [Streptomyces sp. So13.3]|uniref:ATP-binding SpoIIE family protein phosphatase n=1 Tax=Streptomyces TaxID=1883 RepID=UPI001105CDD6|nr:MULTISPECIES: SpoIIE family protein phosphatase [Streptomyces]MCZ4101905.1 SpoIIE family protein phosphatase [Streptomyces sp. H39-C1]QNA76061.1 SpoIIE family protein phosphatase [Streptomyces sp. So13.3]
MDRRIPPGLSGRIPLAVIVVDGAGLVSHWSTGARKLFGCSKEEAVGRPAVDLLPVSGALNSAVVDEGWPDDFGPELDASLSGGTSYPTAGRARLFDDCHGGGADREDGAVDVLWWAYPLVGPGPERLLVLAADATQLRSSPDSGPEEDSADDAQAAHGPAGEFERIAPGFALHTEFSGADQLAKRLPEILPSMNPVESARIVSQVLELGYPVLEFSQHDRVPVTPDWGVPRRDERRARQRAAAAAQLDPQAAASADLAPDLEYAAVREHLEFLNEVSARIGTSLDLARTIQEVSAAVVPRFTDVAGSYLREQVLAGEGFPDGPPDVTTMWYRVAVEHTDEPGRWDDVVPVGESMPFPEHTPFFQCMTSGRPVLVPRISEQMGNAIAAQFEKRDISPLINNRSMLVVPLKARNVVLGFMILLRHQERPVFNDMDKATGAEFAARAGLVLDNARMYTYQENVADTLQDSMLPHITPRMPGCDVATRYLPGTRLGRVGGDWFDTIKLAGSRLALVVGDVMGHGLNSAAMMGQLRTAVQTMAAMGMPPAQLLRNLDDLAQRLGEHYLATCLYAVYDPIESELVISNAGHIPPVLVRAADGRSELLDVPTGAPIGVGGVPFETVTVPVAQGDRLVLCTDGLVEVRGQDIGTGLAALCESAAHPAASMDDACDTIIRALNPRGGRKDDVALLMARLNGIPRSDVATWQLARHPREAAHARRLTRATLRDWDLEEVSETAELLVGEIVTNAIRHAGTSEVELRLVRADALLCEVTDDDHAVPVLLNTGPEDEYGRGMRIVSRLARQWGTSRTAQGKTVWFEQTLPRSASRRRR